MNTLLTVITAANVLILTLLLVFLLRIRAAFHVIRVFFEPEGEGKPSPAAIIADTLMHNAGQAIAYELKTTFMGKQSAQVRAEQGVMADIASDTLNQGHPLIGAVLESFPTLKKRLTKNPELIDFALSKLMPQSAGGSVQAGSNHASSPKFKL